MLSKWIYPINLYTSSSPISCFSFLVNYAASLFTCALVNWETGKQNNIVYCVALAGVNRVPIINNLLPFKGILWRFIHMFCYYYLLIIRRKSMQRIILLTKERKFVNYMFLLFVLFYYFYIKQTQYHYERVWQALTIWQLLVGWLCNLIQ